MKTKEICIFLFSKIYPLLLLTHVNSFAQVSTQINIGAGQSNRWSFNNETENRFRFAYNGGVCIDYYFGKRYFLRGGFYLQTLRYYEFSHLDFDLPGYVGYVETKSNTHTGYYQIPVYAGIQIKRNILGIGLNSNFNFGGLEKEYVNRIEMINGNESSNEYENYFYVRKFDFGLSLIFSTMLSKRLSFKLDIYQGLLDNSKKSSRHDHWTVINMGIGFTFWKQK